MTKQRTLHHPSEIRERYTTLARASTQGREPTARQERVKDAVDLHADVTHSLSYVADGAELGDILVRLEQNIPRMNGVKAAHFQELLALHGVEVGRAYTGPVDGSLVGYDKRVGTLEQHVRKLTTGDDVLADALRTAAVWLQAEFTTWYGTQNLKQSERKKARQLTVRIDEGLVARLEMIGAYGMPPAFEWRFELSSDTEARPYMNEIMESLEPKDRASCSYLIDPKHSDHPVWFLFLNNKHGTHRNMGVIREYTIQMGERMPIVSCEDFETHFARQADFLMGYRVALVDFMKSTDFLRKTNYSKVLLAGMNGVRAEETNELELYRPAMDGGIESSMYGIVLRNSGRRVLPPQMNLMTVMESLQRRPYVSGSGEKV